MIRSMNGAILDFAVLQKHNLRTARVMWPAAGLADRTRYP